MEKRNWIRELLLIVLFVIIFIMIYFSIEPLIGVFGSLISSVVFVSAIAFIKWGIEMWFESKRIEALKDNTNAVKDNTEFKINIVKRNEAMKHSILLKERILNQWVAVNFSLSKEEPSFWWSGDDIQEKLEFKLAKLHIKSGYKKTIWIPWKEAVELIDDMQPKLESIKNMIDDAVYNGLNGIFPNIKPHKFVSYNHPTYTKQYFQNLVWQNMKREYIIKDEGDGIGYANITVITGSQLTESDIINLHKLMDGMLKNEKICNKIRKVREMENKIIINLKDFKKGLQNVILYIDDNNLLQGKCNDNCPNRKLKKVKK